MTQLKKTRQCYQGMKQRCYNERNNQYKNYGLRGISVCDHWLLSFDNFLADMGVKPEGMSIERIDSNGNYEPSNCKWATDHEQRLNQRRNHFIESNGLRLTLRDWSRHLGISELTLHHRLRQGWSIDDALYKPVDPVRSRCGTIGNIVRYSAIAAEGETT